MEDGDVVDVVVVDVVVDVGDWKGGGQPWGRLRRHHRRWGFVGGGDD